MTEIIIPLGRDEVIRRLKRFRDGLGMSRREFGNLDHIRQRGELVFIHTDKHTITIPVALWNELGAKGEEAVLDHKVSTESKH